MHLLVVEDNQKLVANIFEYFEARGHTLEVAPDGVTGLHLANTNTYDAVVLDWNIPQLDGLEVLREIRRGLLTSLPVLMLTARDGLPDKVTVFRAGVDDYLTKPFALVELEVRLQALVTRCAVHRHRKILQVEDLVLDLATLEATRNGIPLHLYPACRKMLEVLLQASPGVVTKSRLEEAIWGEETPPNDMLRTHIYELRRSVDGPFDKKLIHTLARVGYRLAALDSAGHDDG